jgi:hypothetical protein
MLNDYIKYDYNFFSTKEGWRKHYMIWYQKYYPNKFIGIEPLKDEYGQPISSNSYI